MRALTEKQEAFALAYIKTLNATDAYRAVYRPKGGAAGVYVNASKLLKNAKVALRITELRAPALEATGLDVKSTLQEVRRISKVDPRRFYRPDGTMLSPHEWDDDMAAAVASIETIVLVPAKGDTEAKIGYKLKFWDKNSGLEKSMKHLGLFEKDNAQSRENLTLRVEAAKPVRR